MLSRLIAIPALVLSPLAAQAQEAPEMQEAIAATSPVDQRAQDLVAAMRGDLAYDAVFSNGFRTSVPEAQFLAILGQIEGQFGPMAGLEGVTPRSANAAEIRIRFERGIASGNFTLEAEEPHFVSGFLLTGVEPINDSVQAVLDDLAQLPGETSLLVTRLDGSEPLAARNADMPLALGSTFKLYVLSTLVQAVAAGEHSWDEIVPLTQRSYPSGMLQDWPEGAPVTLHTLATLMISISDNTATDQLIAVLGREAIEAEVAASGHASSALMQPFLTTRELFVLKSGPEADLAGFAAAGRADRLASLEALREVERDESAIMAAFTNGPNAIDIEWFASGRDIAALFDRLRADETALGILSVSPGMPDATRAQWQYAGYKGGSEPGVLNLSWLLQGEDGAWRVVTLGWNDPDAVVNQQLLDLLAIRAVALAR